MQRVVQCVVASVLVFTGIALSAQPQERAMGGIVGITVYDDRDFRGRNANFRDDVADLRSSGMNDRIVSFEIARGETWEVCEHAFFGGRCQVFTGYESDLRQRGWGRMISSMRRVRGGGGGGNGGGWGGGGGGGNARGLVLYSGRNFGGESRVIDGFANDLRQLNFNDKAESVRVPRGERWEVCDNIEFVRCQVVEGDISDLNRIGLRRKISSVRPTRGGGGGGWGGGNGGGNGGGGGGGGGWGGGGFAGRITLYTGQNYTGRSFVVDRETANVNMSSAQSVRVDRGSNWQLCEDEGFRGRCTTVNVDIPNIRSLGLPGRVRSARPR